MMKRNTVGKRLLSLLLIVMILMGNCSQAFADTAVPSAVPGEAGESADAQPNTEEKDMEETDEDPASEMPSDAAAFEEEEEDDPAEESENAEAGNEADEEAKPENVGAGAENSEKETNEAEGPSAEQEEEKPSEEKDEETIKPEDKSEKEKSSEEKDEEIKESEEKDEEPAKPEKQDEEPAEPEAKDEETQEPEKKAEEKEASASKDEEIKEPKEKDEEKKAEEEKKASEEKGGEKKALAENTEEENADIRKAPDAADSNEETDGEEEEEETRAGISWPEEYGTPVDDEIKYANDNENVVWQEFTKDGEDILVFRVLDPSLGGADCAITKSFRYEAGLPGRVTKIILEEGITGVGWTENPGVTSAAQGNDTFQKYTSLLTVVPCSTLKQIGWSAFRQCSALSSFDFRACPNLELINNQAFNPTTRMGTVDLSGCANLYYIGQGAFNQETYNSNYKITLPAGGGAISFIGKEAFSASAIETLDLSMIENASENLTISDNAFRNCKALATITFPASITNIKNNLFVGCSGIQTLNWTVERYRGSLNGTEFNASSGFDLFIGKEVARLPGRFFSAVQNAGAVYFEGVSGGHVIEIASNAMNNAPVPLNDIINNVYVDEYGVVYELKDGTAQLAYFSPYEITDYTVPASITTPSGTYPVTAVAPYAFTKAPALQTVRFENAAQISSIGASAFEGVTTLTKVVSGDEETLTVEGAIAFFNENVVGENAFRKTGLGYAVKAVYLVEEPETIGDSVMQTLPDVDGDSEIEGLISNERHSLQDLTDHICQSIRSNPHFPFYTYIFEGWLAEDGEIYAPGTELLLSAVNQDDTDGVVTFRAVWCGHWGSGKGTPSANFSLVRSAKTAAECVASGTIPPEDRSYYTPTLGGSIIYAVGENGLIYPDELRAPSGSSNSNVGYIYENYLADAPAAGRYMMISYLGSSVWSADSAVRSLASDGYYTDDSESGPVTWRLYMLPDVLGLLREMVENGETSVRDESGAVIPAADLTPENYSVFWCQVKYQPGSGDGWNINGFLASHYTVEFDPNGGEGVMDDLPMIFGVEKELSANVFTREGYVFTGWNTAADGSGTSYSDRQNAKNIREGIGSVTLYAQWMKLVEVSVAATDSSVPYNGDEQSNSDWSLIFMAGGEVISSLPEGISVTVTCNDATAEEPYSIAASGTDAGTYTAAITAVLSGEAEGYAVSTETSSATLSLTITPKAVTVTAQDHEFTYNGTAQSWPEYSVTGLVGEDAISAVVTGSITFPSESPVDNVVSSYEFTSGTPGNYVVTPANGQLTMTNASVAITITAASESREYNGNPLTNTVVTVTEGTLLNGDTLVATATGSATDVADTAEGNNPVAEGYKVMHGTEDVTANYAITPVAGTLTITPKAVTVTAQDHEFTYNGTAQSWPEYSVTGLVGEDAISAVVTGSITFPSESPVDNVVSSYEFTSGTPGNYVVTPANGQLTMTNASVAITITAASESREYNGNPLTNTVVTVTEGTLLNGDTLVATATGSATDVADTAEGNNPVAEGYKVMHGTEDVTANYAITPVAGTLTITPKAATVTADAKSKVYGAADPELTAQVSGLVGEDTLSYTLSRVAGENVGEYAIEVTLGENANYAVTATGAKLTITPKAATITADAKSKVYGAADPELTAQVSGLVGEDTLSYTLSRVAGENVGTYAIRVTPGANTNYAVTANDAVLTITPKAATVTADAKSKVYGAADPELTAQVSGLVGEDTLSYTLSRVAGENVGEYAIEVTLGENANYAVTATGAKLTITPKAVTVSADNKTKTQGNADPALTAAVQGTLGGDTVVYTLNRAPGEAAGGYAITPTGAATQGNYTVTYVPGTLTIQAAPVVPPVQPPAQNPVQPAQNPVQPAQNPVQPAQNPVQPAQDPVQPAQDPVPAPAQTSAPGPEPTSEPGPEPTPEATIEPVTIPDEPTPLANFTTWALSNLIAAIGTVLSALGMILSFFRKRSDGADKTRSAGKFFGLIPAIAALAVFFLTEDMAGRMVLTDRWTIPMFVILALNGALAYFTRGGKTEGTKDA